MILFGIFLSVNYQLINISKCRFVRLEYRTEGCEKLALHDKRRYPAILQETRQQSRSIDFVHTFFQIITSNLQNGEWNGME